MEYDRKLDEDGRWTELLGSWSKEVVFCVLGYVGYELLLSLLLLLLPPLLQLCIEGAIVLA